MAAIQTDTILRHVRDLIHAHAAREASDTELLRRYAAKGDQAAFTALVQRHGPLVWGVCRRVLHHEQDAEDSFQAAFLVLARNAASIRKRAAVASWLYGVAYRIATRAKVTAARRRARECPLERTAPCPVTEAALREVQAILDEEVRRLPEKYRAPFVLCCLEGKSKAEAARELGWKDGTLSARLAFARERLRARRARRGVSLSAALTAAALAQGATLAAVPAALLDSTLNAIASFGGGGATSAVPARVLALARGPLVVFAAVRLQLVALLVPLTVAAGLAVSPSGDRGGAQPPRAAAPTPAGPRPAGRTDLHGDPLPATALARLGTLRQRAPDAHIAVSADGKEVVAVSPDLTVRRFDAQTGVLLTVRRLPGGPAYRLWLSPRGTLLLLSRFREPEGYRLELWDVARAKLERTLPLGRSSPWGAAFSADEHWVAVADSTGNQDVHRVAIWDLPTGKFRALWSEERPIRQRFFDPVVALSADGKRLAAVHLDLKLRCWDADGGKLLWEAPGKTWSPFLFFRPDGRVVVTASRIGQPGVTLHDTATGAAVEDRKLPEKAAHPVGYSPDGKLLAFVTGFEEMALWEPGAARVAARLPRPARPRDQVHRIPNRLWDATLGGGGRRGRLTAARAEALWVDLAGADAARAYGAVWQLAADPERAVPLLQGRLRPVQPAPPEMTQALLRDLDSAQFAARRAAERKLRALGERAEPALREALKAGPPIETKRRVEGVLAALAPAAPLEGEPLRGLRAVQVLERIGSRAAQRVLEGLAGGVTAARLTREARAALERLARRPAVAP